MPKVEIKSDGIRTQLLVDGVDISGITSAFALSQKAQNVPVLTLEIPCAEVTVDTITQMQFPPEIQKFITNWNEMHSAAPAATETAE